MKVSEAGMAVTQRGAKKREEPLRRWANSQPGLSETACLPVYRPKDGRRASPAITNRVNTSRRVAGLAESRFFCSFGGSYWDCASTF